MQQTTILKFTPTFRHPCGTSIIKKPQTQFSNFSNIHKITNNKPFHNTNCPKICITSKPFQISSCSKKNNADANSKNSTSTTEKKLQLNVSSAFDPIFSAVKRIAVSGFVTVSKLRTPRFEHYMEVRKKVLSEIDEIRIKHGVSKEESALGDRVKLIRSR